jgi:hypothetical protein
MTAFQLRVPDHIMQQAKAAAAEEQTSVNQLLLAFIAEGLGQRRGLRMMRERAARADVAAALAIVDRAPDVQPDPRDAVASRKKSRD